MMRQFVNNLKEAGMVFGQLLIPMLQKVMPFLNGVTIALKNLLVTIASLLGINLDLDSFGQGFSDLGEDMEDVADGFGDASKAVKEFKGQLLGIDELNVLNSGNSASGGSGIAMTTIDLTEQIIKATEEYEKAWDNAYKRMQNKAQQIADKINDILAPVKGVFANLFNGQYYAAGYGFGDIFKNIFEWLADQISKVDWQRLGKNIGDFLAGIKWSEIFTSGVNLFGEIMQSALDTWEGFKDTAPLEAKLIQLATIVSVTGFGKALMARIIALLSATGFGFVPTVVIGAIAWDIAFDVGKSLGKALFPDDKIFYDNFKIFGSDGFFKAITEDLETTRKALDAAAADWENNPMIASLYTFFIGGKAESPTFITDFVDKTKKEVISACEDIGKALYDLWENKVKPTFNWENWKSLIINITTSVKNQFKDMVNSVIGFLNGVIGGIEKMVNNFAKGFFDMAGLLNNIPFIEITVSEAKVISLPKIPQYKNGGFPEDGLFYANHNELVGQFSNGKTAVANNEQIVSGIESGVERAVTRVLAPYLADIAESSRTTANKEFGITRRQAFNAVREEANIFKKSTGIPAF